MVLELRFLAEQTTPTVEPVAADATATVGADESQDRHLCGGFSLNRRVRPLGVFGMSLRLGCVCESGVLRRCPHLGEECWEA